jgi:hypothetical protein
VQVLCLQHKGEGSEVLHLKNLGCTKIVQREQLVVPWIRKGTDPYVLAKSAESHDSKGLPEPEEHARVRKSLILKGRKKHTRAFIGKRTPKPVKGKRVEFRLMEKWTSEFRPGPVYVTDNNYSMG